MLSELRYHLTPQRVLIAAATLILAALVIPWLPPYSGLSDSLANRHLEARGRAPQQVQQRSAAERRAAEEEARRTAEAEQAAQKRRDEEEAQRRRQRDHGLQVAEFRRIAEAHLPPIRTMLQNVSGTVQAIQQSASKPDFYRGNVITPEDTSSRRPCGDPASASDWIDRNTRRDRNIYGCAVYLSTNQDERGPPRTVTVALLQRIDRDEAARIFPVQTLIAYVWIGLYRERLRLGQDVPPLPEMTAGDRLNPALFGNTLSAGFATRMIDTATTEEKLSLRNNVYPDLKRMSELAPRIIVACRALQRTDCLEVD